MTHEQFLKQLRRIGIRFIISSIILSAISLIIAWPIYNLRRAIEIFLPILVFGLIGVCIYPDKSEE